MLGQPLQSLPGQVEPVEARVAPFQPGHDPQALGVVVESAMGREGPVQRPLAGMPERRVAEVMGQRQRFGQILVEAERAGDGAGDLGHFQRMGKPGPEVVPFVVDKDLRLVLQAAKRIGMDDAVAVALERRAERVFQLGVDSAPRSGRD
jgi:hypothetical protein